MRTTNYGNGGLKMKRKRYVFVLVCIVLFVLLLIAYMKKYENVNSNAKYQVILGTDEFCTDTEELYTEIEDRKIYLICISEILTNYENKEYSLKELLSNNTMTLNELYALANEEIKYKDGGSIQYIYDNFTITKCNGMSGRKDILISNEMIDINACYQ